MLVAMLMAALTGGAAVRAVDRARGIHVDLGPDGDEIHVWNSTTSTWGRCSIMLNDHYGVQANKIPGRTLLMLPKRLSGAPKDWDPRYAAVRCQNPRLAQWASRIRRLDSDVDNR